MVEPKVPAGEMALPSDNEISEDGTLRVIVRPGLPAISGGAVYGSRCNSI